MKASVDLQIGGRYCFAFPNERGADDLLCGEYLEIVPAKRLVFTWDWREGGSDTPASPTTIVTVEFLDCGSDCEVIVTHEGFVDETQLEFHDLGWRRSLARLESIVADGKSLERTAS